jgi:NAD(P)-dependent dehydrogenase (short-subunit alcohol dehydrogenase family)
MNNRIALVTGGGRGIGHAIALELARAGARVAVSARTEEQLQQVVEQITRSGGQALPITADVSDPVAPARVLDAVRKHWGDVEILVNNAGIGSSANPKPLVNFDDEFWDLTFAINVKAVYLLSKLALPAMVRNRWGRIINISSINAKIPSLHGAAYTASKHAVIGLTKVAAMEHAKDGITVNAICPGVVRSDMNEKRMDYDSARLGKSKEEIESNASPLGRRLEPTEIATAVAFLASDGASAINGQSINVCAGTVMF